MENPLKKVGDMAKKTGDQMQNAAQTGGNMANNGMNAAGKAVGGAGSAAMNGGKKGLNKILALGLPVLLVAAAVGAFLIFGGSKVSKEDLQSSIDKLAEIKTANDKEPTSSPFDAEGAAAAAEEFKVIINDWDNLNDELDDTKGITHKEVKDEYTEYLEASKDEKEIGNAIAESTGAFPVITDCGNTLLEVDTDNSVDVVRAAVADCKQAIAEVSPVPSATLQNLLDETSSLMDSLTEFADKMEANPNDAQNVADAQSELEQKISQYQLAGDDLENGDEAKIAERYDDALADLRKALQDALADS